VLRSIDGSGGGDDGDINVPARPEPEDLQLQVFLEFSLLIAFLLPQFLASVSFVANNSQSLIQLSINLSLLMSSYNLFAVANIWDDAAVGRA
jgi:hypothetical protein